MCGIIGYTGTENVTDHCGRLKAEYRGYDSAGVAVMNEDGFKSLTERCLSALKQ